MESYVIVGLGNPGAQYAHTRHNAGFDVIEILSQKMRIALAKPRFRALVGEGRFEGGRIVLAKPQTYMNLSGESVAALCGWYKPLPDHLVVVYDDVDLPFGAVRVRASGSAGTHNGMRSVVGSIGRTDFPRVRVGIGAPPANWDMADWVTGHYADAAERQIAFDGYLRAADAVLTLLRDGVEAAMRQANRKPTKEEP
ncbi:MAG: aminoacyl-tRNA hydrolase [Oscillospiraceae bacterium]|jgi:PTH1 family peptidyl-tRNA hydrolase|nr:aminoacyl-tRNA hydrolase [Oscillospiraceae bacterium]